MSSKKKNTGLDDMVLDLKRRFGDDSVMTLDEQPVIKVPSISTQSIGLDSALGIGGLPRGRVTEIYGPEATGKTTLALHVVAEAQSKGYACAFVDVENALDPSYARRIGVDTKRLLISQPQGGEEALQIVEAMARSGEVGVIVVDSVSALVPKDEAEGQIGDRHMAGQARLMSQAMRLLVPAVARKMVVLIFINQLRTNIGAYSPSGIVPETTSGGRALRYAASVRIDLRRLSSIKRGEEVVGSRIKAKVVKNKLASPFRIAEYDVMYGEGISREGEILALGEERGVLRKTGAGYYYGDVSIGRGLEAARANLAGDPALAATIESDISTSVPGLNGDGSVE